MDSEPVGLGWLGTYLVAEPGSVTAIERDGSCTSSCTYQVSDEQLTVEIVSNPCSEEDELFQTVIFESAPFNRVR